MLEVIALTAALAGRGAVQHLTGTLGGTESSIASPPGSRTQAPVTAGGGSGGSGTLRLDARTDVRPFYVDGVAQVPCEETFERMARDHTELLLDWMTSGLLAPTDLTFAAELAGRFGHSERVVEVLAALLCHEKPYVQEGALYGLARHLRSDAAANALRRLIEDESSNAAIRELASELLETPPGAPMSEHALPATTQNGER